MSSFYGNASTGSEEYDPSMLGSKIQYEIEEDNLIIYNSQIISTEEEQNNG